MTQLVINVGAAPNDGQGDPIRTSFIKTNSNFSELYSRAQTTPPTTLIGNIGDQAGMYAYSSSYFYYCFSNYNGNTPVWAEVAQIGNIAVSSINSGNTAVSIPNINGNVQIAVNSANVARFTTGGLSVTGNISASGNVTGAYVLGNGSQLTGLPASYANANVAAYLPVYTGNIAAGNLAVTSNVIAGNISTTGNVVSSGNLTAGNITSTNEISAVANIVTSGYFVGNFLGNIVGNLVVPGSNTQVLFNTDGNADATAGMTFTKGPNIFNVLGNISTTTNLIGNAILSNTSISANGTLSGGNIITGGNVTAGNVSASGNVNASALISSGAVVSNTVAATGNISTSSQIIATGNIATGGKLTATGDINAGGNISATNFTGSAVSVVGNITGTTLNANGQISAGGNVTADYYLGNGAFLTGVITSVSNISLGTSNVTVLSSGGNIGVAVAGTSNIATFSINGLHVGGDSEATNVIASTALVTQGNLITSSAGTNLVFGTDAVSVTGNVQVDGNYILNSAGDIGLQFISGNSQVITGGNLKIGTGGSNSIAAGAIAATTVSATGNITANVVTVNNGLVNGGANATGNIGSATSYFDQVFAQATSAIYADLAELYLADAEYAPGTVLTFGGDAEVTVSTADSDPTVAGVVSTRPAYQMNSGLTGANTVALALVGRVPCLVEGPVRRGQMMVSAGNGRARAELHPAMGTVLGKALESFDGELGTIEIVVGRL